jgi:hypothetical protein
VSDLRSRYFRLLKAYPRSYRDQRGEEILATLLESSAPGSRYPDLRDAADLVLHGVQMRLGLTSERFAGRVLDVAATPGLALAAAFSVFFFVYAELFPFLNHSYGSTFALINGHSSIVSQPHFGPFSTTGVVVYIGWVLATLGALAWPSHQRTLASLGVGITLVAIVGGKVFFAAPRVPLMVVIVAFALPAVLAPSTGPFRDRFGWSALAAGALLTLMWWRAGRTIRLEAFGIPFRQRSFESWYATSVYLLGDVVRLVGVLAVAAVLTLLVFRRASAAGALALLTAPWLVIAYTYHVQSGYDVEGTALLVALPLLWLFGAWIADLIRPRARPIGPAQLTS